MGRTGESVRRLTRDGFNPSWSPDGASIVYASQSVVDSPGVRDARGQLWIASTATGDRRQLTTADAVQPAWSPHGHRIAYWGLPHDSAQRDLWTIAAGGGEAVRVTNDPAIEWSPAWSPDGRFLYFSSNRSGGFNLWRVALDETTGQTSWRAGSGADSAARHRTPQHLGGWHVARDGVDHRPEQHRGMAFDPARGTVGRAAPGD